VTLPPSQPLITVDVGNSRTNFGLFDRRACEVNPGLPECIQAIAVRSDEPIPWHDIASWCKGGRETFAVIAGGNPDGIKRVHKEWPWDPGTLRTISNTHDRLPLKTQVDEPDKVGIDRLLNVLAANAVRVEHQPVLVVDSGTATTVDAVSTEGAFLGGAILPGFALCAHSLNQYTALLPLISMDEVASGFHEAVGRDTHQAICSGLLWGHIGAVRELLKRMADLVNPLSPASDATAQNETLSGPMVLMTGGGTTLLAPHFPQARREPYLVSQGLAIAACHIDR
jgi:type III pantothenate kinase